MPILRRTALPTEIKACDAVGGLAKIYPHLGRPKKLGRIIKKDAYKGDNRGMTEHVPGPGQDTRCRCISVGNLAARSCTKKKPCRRIKFPRQAETVFILAAGAATVAMMELELI